MGGSIGFTVREESGAEHRMCRWTNSMNSLFHSVDFYNKSSEHLKSYLSAWYDMVEDYKQSKKTKKKTQLNMTTVYAPYPFLAPMGYGLVVVDYKTNTVISMQNYTSHNILQKYVCVDAFKFKSKEDLKVVKALCDEQKVTGYAYWENNEAEELSRVEKILSFEEVGKITKNKSIDLQHFELNTSPWTFHRLPENYEGVVEFKKRVLDLGFELSKKEMKLWDEWEKFKKEREIENQKS